MKFLKISILRANELIPKLILFGTISFLVFITISNLANPILDEYGFRQTQTAITSYYFIQDGFKLAYETPAVGYPWSIPFEFPIFQALVALSVKLFSIPSWKCLNSPTPPAKIIGNFVTFLIKLKRFKS